MKNVESESSTLIKKLLCSYCGNCFKSRNNLKNHLRIHDVGIYSCDKCPKTFYRKEHLRDHFKAFKDFNRDCCGKTLSSFWKQ